MINAISRQDSGLSSKQTKFVSNILKGLSQIESYKKAGYTCKSDTVASNNASRLMSNPKVRQYLQREYLILNTHEDPISITRNEVTATARKVIESGLQSYHVTDSQGNTILNTEGEPLTKLVAGKEVLTANEQLGRLGNLMSTGADAVQVNFQINLNGIKELESKTSPLPPKDGGVGCVTEVPLPQKTGEKEGC